MASAAFEKQKRPQDLEVILTAFEASLDSYDRNVPSLFCDEHAISEMMQP
jgi:hypothetical protein